VDLVLAFLPGGGGRLGSAVAAGDVDVAVLADEAGEFVEVADFGDAAAVDFDIGCSPELPHSFEVPDFHALGPGLQDEAAGAAVAVLVREGFPPCPVPQRRRTHRGTARYIRWYNTERISTKLEGLNPVQYRAQALAA
jgi:hypothetical protein